MGIWIIIIFLFYFFNYITEMYEYGLSVLCNILCNVIAPRLASQITLLPCNLDFVEKCILARLLPKSLL